MKKGGFILDILADLIGVCLALSRGQWVAIMLWAILTIFASSPSWESGVQGAFLGWLLVAFIVLTVGAVAAGFLLQIGSIRGAEPDPATLDDFTFPTDIEDRVIPDVFGTARIYPNLCWYDNFDAKKRKKKGQVVGFGYYFSQLHAIAGVIDDILEFRVDDKPTAFPIRVIDVTLANATWEPIARTLTEVGAFASYTWTTGDLITLTDGPAESGVPVTLAIESRDSNDQITLFAAFYHRGGSGYVTEGKLAFVAKTGPEAHSEAVPSNPKSLIRWVDGTANTLWTHMDDILVADNNEARGVVYKGSSLLRMAQTFVGDDVRAFPNISLVVRRLSRELHDPGTWETDGDPTRSSGTAILVDGAILENDTTVDLKGLTVGATILVGDAFRIRGTTTLFRVTVGDTADGGGLASITFTPAAGVGGWGDEDTVDVPDISRMNGDDDNEDANPADLLWYIYTSLMAEPVARLDQQAFEDAQYTLASEGIGISVPLLKAKSLVEWQKDINRHIDATVFWNDQIGKRTITLFRADYTIGDLPTLTDADLEVAEWVRGSWDAVYSDVTFKWTNPSSYELTPYQMTNPATRRILGAAKAQTVSLPFIRRVATMKPTIARVIRRYYVPLGAGKFTISKARIEEISADEVTAGRVARYMNPGEVYKWTSALLGITDRVIRVLASDGGGETARHVDLEISEDVIPVTDPDFIDIEDPPPPIDPNLDLPIQFPFYRSGLPELMDGDHMIFGATPPTTGTTSEFEVTAWFLQQNRIGAFCSLDEDDRVTAGARPYCMTGVLQAALVTGDAVHGAILVDSPVNFSAFSQTDAEWTQALRLMIIEAGVPKVMGAVGGSASSMTVDGLPAGFVIAKGVHFEVSDDSDSQRWGRRVTAAATANGSGEVTFNFDPDTSAPGFANNADVIFDNAFEVLAVQTAVETIEDTTWTISNLIREFGGYPQIDHAAGARVWIFPLTTDGGGFLNLIDWDGGWLACHEPLRFRPTNNDSKGPEISVEVPIRRRALEPYSPGDLQATRDPRGIGVDDEVQAEWVARRRGALTKDWNVPDGWNDPAPEGSFRVRAVRTDTEEPWNSGPSSIGRWLTGSGTVATLRMLGGYTGEIRVEVQALLNNKSSDVVTIVVAAA